MTKFKRSLPFFEVLIKAVPQKRSEIIKSFPPHVVDDLCEILYNIVTGRVNVGTLKNKFKRHKKALLDLKNAKGRKGRRKIIFKQKGGFWTLLLPIIAKLAMKLFRR